MWAARSGILDAVSLLCKKGGDPTLYDNQGYNALHLAAHGAHYHTMLFLIVCLKMDIDSLDSMGRTALMVRLEQMAVRDGKLKLLCVSVACVHGPIAGLFRPGLEAQTGHQSTR
jgi:hypothetical protein